MPSVATSLDRLTNLRAGLARLRAAIGTARGDGELIVDRGRRLGDFDRTDVAYDTSLVKEQVARDFLFSLPGEGLSFLDVGARDGRLDYLLGIHRNLEIDGDLYRRNRARFDAKFRYYGLDLAPDTPDENVLGGDICADDFLGLHADRRGFFDVVYSNNVFEHLRRPWVAAGTILELLKPGGACITIAPFSLRYHESPEDHFRYTHTGLVALFQEHAPVRTVVAGYDLTGRRNNWQGMGAARDIVPVDEFGAWRENWFVIAIVEKPVE
jgi:SAM-dependent methyltransferase